MAQDIALQQLAQQMQANLPAVFKQRMLTSTSLGKELGEGITSGFAVVSIRGKVWRIKHRGEERTLLMPDRRTPRYSINVVIVKAAPNISKIWYEHGYVEGSTAPPDCWSVDGKVPDRASPKLQNPTCGGCKWNAWGSSRTQGGTGKGKDCADSKRLAIVPTEDIDNEFYGGPMLIRIPPSSLGDLGAYAASLQTMGIPYCGVETELFFDHTSEYPKIMFKAVGVLDDAKAEKVLALYDSPAVERILATPIENVSTDGVDTSHAVPAATPGQQAPQQPPAGFKPTLVPAAPLPAADPATPPPRPLNKEEVAWMDEIAKAVGIEPKEEPVAPPPPPVPAALAVDPRLTALINAGVTGELLVNTAKAMGIEMPGTAAPPAPAPKPDTLAVLAATAPKAAPAPKPAGNPFAPPPDAQEPAPTKKAAPKKAPEAPPAPVPVQAAPTPAEAATPPSEAAAGSDTPEAGTIPPDFDNLLHGILG